MLPVRKSISVPHIKLTKWFTCVEKCHSMRCKKLWLQDYHMKPVNRPVVKHTIGIQLHFIFLQDCMDSRREFIKKHTNSNWKEAFFFFFFRTLQQDILKMWCNKIIDQAFSHPHPFFKNSFLKFQFHLRNRRKCRSTVLFWLFWSKYGLWNILNIFMVKLKSNLCNSSCFRSFCRLSFFVFVHIQCEKL